MNRIGGRSQDPRPWLSLIYDDSNNHPRWYHFPSLMINGLGDLVVGCSGSSELIYVSAFYSVVLIGQATALGPRCLKAGEAPYPIHYWGDYSATTLDPVDGSIWTVQEYAKPYFLSDPSWGTWVSKIIP